MALGILGSAAPYHLLAFSVAYGTNIFHSYINAPLLFKNLPRENFSHVTNLVLPKYFLAEAIVPIGLYLTLPAAIAQVASLQKYSVWFLGISSLFQALNYLWLLPNVQRLKAGKLQLEDEYKALDAESERAKEIKAELQVLSKQFGKYHGLSLLFNLVNTIGLTGYGFVLSNGLARYLPK